MGTAANIVRGALKELGVLAAGETLEAADQADGLDALNRMLGTWANERMLVNGLKVTSHTLTPNLYPHSIGPGGTLNTTRPLRIDGANIIAAGQTAETPLRLLTDAEWQGIPNKTQTGEPTSLWVAWYPVPFAHLWLWPVPSAASTLVLYQWSRIAAFAASDSVTLADGYEDALVLSLALRLAPSYGEEPSPTLVQLAMDAVAAIKRTNAPDVEVEIDPALLGVGAFNINTGSY